MARWRTHNRRADKKRRMPYARFKRLRKAARFGYMYGMGARRIADAFKGIGMTAREARTKMEEFRNSVIPAVFRRPEATAPIPSPIFHNWDEVEARVLAQYRHKE
jgi:hypothetical protein